MSKPRTRRPFSGGWRGYTIQILVSIVLPVTLLMLVVAVGSTVLHQDAMWALVTERDERLADSLVDGWETRLAAYRLVLRNADAPLAAILAAPRLQDEPGFQAAAFRDPQGGLRLAGDLAIWQTASMQKALLDNPWGRPFTAYLPELDVLLIGAETGGRGSQALGVVRVSQLVEKGFLPGIGQTPVGLLVLDETGQVVYQRRYAGDTLDDWQRCTVPLEEQPRSLADKLFNTHGHVMACSLPTSGGWRVVVAEPWHSVSSMQLRYTLLAPLVLVPLLILAVIVVVFGVQQIIRPLQLLEEEAVAVGNGDFGRMQQPVGGIAEIRHLQAELAELARKVRDAQQSLRSYIGAITRGQEDERRRLARELHDDTLQALIALNQRVQMLHYVKGAEQQQAQIAELQALLDSTMKDLRRLTGALRPTYLEELGLITALEMLAREAGQGGKSRVHLTRQGREKRLPPEVELSFYRIAQEGINNALRHANCGRVQVLISFAPEEVLLQIEDDGQGFDPPETPGAFAAQGHFGLLGMVERAELIQAALQIESSPGQGTRIRLRWRP